MTYFEPEAEKKIIERLDRMKAKIDAFVASLEEPFEQKRRRIEGGERVAVRAGRRGRLNRVKTSGYVYPRDVICKVITNVEDLDRRRPVYL
jgi:pyruvate-formate lyase-activating enzyme